MFDRQPTLVGSLLELRPLRAGDWTELFAVASDPLIWEQHPESDRYQEPVFKKFFADALASGGALVAIERSSGRIVGSSRYHGFDPDRSVVEIGWSFLARRCWGGAYNGEMKRLMLDHAFQTVQRVIFVIGPENRRSRRAVEKIGAVYAGTTLDPKGRERVVYELARAAGAGGARCIRDSIPTSLAQGMTVELCPLDTSHDALLSSLQQQEDVWEFIGTLPVSARERSNHVFAVMEGAAALGFAGLVKSQAAGGDDFELLCAMRSEAQQRGVAKQACQLVLDWAFQTGKLERVIACIDQSNHPARTIAEKIGMEELGPQSASRIIYVKYRDERRRALP